VVAGGEAAGKSAIARVLEEEAAQKKPPDAIHVDDKVDVPAASASATAAA
jgi:hypothetical protein